MKCDACDDTRFTGTDAYGERVRCRACAPTVGVTTTPAPKPAGWDAIADGNTRAAEEMMAEKAAAASAPLTPADGTGGYCGPGCGELFDEIRRIAPDAAVPFGEVPDYMKELTPVTNELIDACRTPAEAFDRGKMTRAELDAVRDGLRASMNDPKYVIAEPEPERPEYAPWVKRGASEIQYGPFAVVVKVDRELTRQQEEGARGHVANEFRSRGAAVPPIFVVAPGVDVQMPSYPPRPPEWYHLPGRSIRVGAVQAIEWAADHCRVFVAGTDLLLFGDQMADLRRLTGAPDPAPGGAAG